MPTIDFSFNLSQLIGDGFRVLVILGVTMILFWVAGRAIPRAIEARIPNIREESPDELAQRSKTLSRAMVRAVRIFLTVTAGLMIFSTLGVAITPVLASVGIAALALGFAAQNIIRDYLHGFFIIMEDWYRVGEVAIVAGTGGLVQDLTLRRTILRDLSGTMHVIPNSKIEFASNMTRDWSRINLDVPVAYGTNLDQAFRVINEVGQQMHDDPVWGEALLTTPHVERVNNFGEHGVEIKILGDTKPIRQWALMGELRKRLKDRFDQEGIEIPWSFTKVYFGDSYMGDGLASLAERVKEG